MSAYRIKPDPADPRLTNRVAGLDHHGQAIETSVVVERPLTLYLNGQEIVTLMTVGDYPRYLAVGFLLNQNMLHADDEITGIDHDEELDVVVVRTTRETDYERKLAKKVRTSGCAQGTAFGDLMETFDEVALNFLLGAFDRLFWQESTRLCFAEPCIILVVRVPTGRLA